MTPVILATGGYDHKIRFWDANSGHCSRTLPFGDSQINALQVSQDKCFLLAAGNPFIHLYDINSNDDRPFLVNDGHTGNVMSIGFQRDQRWIYSGGEDCTVRILDPRTNSNTRKYETTSSVNTVVLHPNQLELISGEQGGAVKVWDLRGDKLREEFTPALDMPVRSVSIVSNF